MEILCIEMELKMRNKILTIGITSYNRVDELKRCIESIQTKYIDEIEIIVSEDQSPKHDEIKQLVMDLSKKSDYEITFNTNEKNLGYDKNLGKLIEASKGEYILLMSDDDQFSVNAIDTVIELIMKEDVGGVILSPYKYNSSGKLDRKHSKSKRIKTGIESVNKYIYDSILFSGLVFKREYIKDISAEYFRNFNYFQVYLMCFVLYKYGGYYLDYTTILCMGDGENAYGISESSGGNELLANRKSVISNLEFNIGLIKTIKKFDLDFNANAIKSFSIQYSLHSYSGLSIARREGKYYFKEYWKKLNSLDIDLLFITKIYYYTLLIFGTNITNIILSIFKFIRLKYRELVS